MLISRSFLCFVFVAACGGKVDVGPDASPGDAGPTFDASPPTTDASPPPPPLNDAGPGQCTDLDVLGSSITLNEVAADPPPFASNGGAITEGEYELTALTVYTGPQGSSGSGGTIDAVARITTAKNGWLFEVATVNDGQPPTQRSTTDVVATGPGALELTQTCPTTEPGISAFYAVDGPTLTLRVESAGATADETLALVMK